MSNTLPQQKERVRVVISTAAQPDIAEIEIEFPAVKDGSELIGRNLTFWLATGGRHLWDLWMNNRSITGKTANGATFGLAITGFPHPKSNPGLIQVRQYTPA